jgi:hypothetical protein
VILYRGHSDKPDPRPQGTHCASPKQDVRDATDVWEMDSPSFLDPQLKLGGVKALLPRINNDRCPGS